MLQKVAAILGKVAADLCFRVSNMDCYYLKNILSLPLLMPLIWVCISCASIYYSGAEYSAFWCFDVEKCQYDYFRYNKPAI